MGMAARPPALGLLGAARAGAGVGFFAACGTGAPPPPAGWASDGNASPSSAEPMSPGLVKLMKGKSNDDIFNTEGGSMKIGATNLLLIPSAPRLTSSGNDVPPLKVADKAKPPAAAADSNSNASAASDSVTPSSAPAAA